MQLVGTRVPSDLHCCADMAKVTGNSSRVCNIVEAELADKAAAFEQQGQGLANPASCAQDSDFGLQKYK